MAAMLRLVGSNRPEAEERELEGREPEESAALVVLSEKEFRRLLARAARPEKQAA